MKNLNEISEVAKKYNIIILSDEIYSELSFEMITNQFLIFVQKKQLLVQV